MKCPLCGRDLYEIDDTVCVQPSSAELMRRLDEALRDPLRQHELDGLREAHRLAQLREVGDPRGYIGDPER